MSGAKGFPSADGRVEDTLVILARHLREEGSVISEYATESSATPALGLLAAAGPRCREAPGAYATAIEAIREGYLLHYGEARIVRPPDPDLGLLAGDYLYARGLEVFAGRGDLEAIRELADLISLCAQLHSGAHAAAGGAPPLWLSTVCVVAAGPSEGHRAAKRALREGDGEAGARLWEAASATARRAAISDALQVAAEAVGFRSS